MQASAFSFYGIQRRTSRLTTIQRMRGCSIVCHCFRNPAVTSYALTYFAFLSRDSNQSKPTLMARAYLLLLFR